jgi:hypothetical protein
MCTLSQHEMCGILTLRLLFHLFIGLDEVDSQLADETPLSMPGSHMCVMLFARFICATPNHVHTVQCEV